MCSGWAGDECPIEYGSLTKPHTGPDWLFPVDEVAKNRDLHSSFNKYTKNAVFRRKYNQNITLKIASIDWRISVSIGHTCRYGKRMLFSGYSCYTPPLLFLQE